MCTAISYHTNNHLFVRNLDLEFSYDETVTITPREYELKFRHDKHISNHYAIIGMAYVVDDYPLYYDAMNEYGLGMAGLNFPNNAKYYEPSKKFNHNITSFEFIPWILSQCKTVDEAHQKLMTHIAITDDKFCNKLPPSPLHWMITDKEKSIVVEHTKDGLHVYDNPVGVMTNNPTFDKQLFNLNNYSKLSVEPVTDTFAKDLELDLYSRGMGAIGLPGDLSSMSRFVRATFVKLNSLSDGTKFGDISQFFHILKSVEQQRGCVHIKDDKYEITIYSSCCNLDTGVYYYTTYDNHRIQAINMFKENLDSDNLVCFDVNKTMAINFCNE